MTSFKDWQKAKLRQEIRIMKRLNIGMPWIDGRLVDIEAKERVKTYPKEAIDNNV